MSKRFILLLYTGGSLGCRARVSLACCCGRPRLLLRRAAAAGIAAAAVLLPHEQRSDALDGLLLGLHHAPGQEEGGPGVEGGVHQVAACNWRGGEGRRRQLA